MASFLTRSCGKEPVAPRRGSSECFPSLEAVCPAPILLGSLLEMSWHALVQQGTIEVSGAAHVTPKCLPGFLHSQAAIPVCHIISRTVLRAVHPSVSISLPRGCDEFAAGDLWQFVLGKCLCEARDPVTQGNY